MELRSNLFLVVVFCAVGLTTSVGPLVDIDAEIRAAVDECGQKSGLTVAIVSRNGSFGDFTYAQGFGFRNIEANISADENSLLCIGSVTKHFTATLLVYLLDLLNSAGHQPRYSLQTLITDLDKSLLFTGSELVNVTLEDILSHRTGLTDYFGPLMMGYPTNYTAKNLAHVATQLPRLAPARQRFIYNNHVYALGGYACEILGSIYHNRSITWEELLQLHFFDKLGIAQNVSFAVPNSGYLDRVALPYVTYNGGKYLLVPNQVTETVKPAASAGAICMSAKAMTVWMELLMNRGTYQGQIIIKPDLIEDTWKPRISVGDKPGESQYGLGWGIANSSDTRIIQHSGGISAFYSNLLIYPELRHALFISNSIGYQQNAEILHQKISSIFTRAFNLTQLPTENPNFTCSAIPVPSNASEPSAEIDMFMYTGSYHHPVYGNLELKKDGELLTLEIGQIGQARVHCRRSGVCILTFFGLLEYISIADGSMAANSTIEFGKSCSGYVVNVTIPMYSPDPLTYFTRPAPSGEKCQVSGGPRSASNTVAQLKICLFVVIGFFVSSYAQV